jgi:hypothetical protein
MMVYGKMVKGKQMKLEVLIMGKRDHRKHLPSCKFFILKGNSTATNYSRSQHPVSQFILTTDICVSSFTDLPHIFTSHTCEVCKYKLENITNST